MSFFSDERPLDDGCVSEGSRFFVGKLLCQFPTLASYLGMGRSTPDGAYDAFAEIESPTGDSSRTVLVWMDDGDDPSISFGSWHTHGSLSRGADTWEARAAVVFDFLNGILSDRIVLVEQAGTLWDTLLDLRKEEELLDMLTDPLSSEELLLKSWSGAADRVVTVEGEP